jgi:murein peptide amidase A
MERKVLRRPLTRVLLLVFVLAAAWALVSSNRDWFLFHLHRSDSVRDGAAMTRTLQGTGLDTQQAGSVRYGGETIALWVLRHATPRPRAPTACLVAGVHGNEPAGVQALLAFAARLHDRPLAYEGIRFVLVPVANPWGWQRDLRHDGDNRDVARQFVSGESQESALLKPLFAGEHCDLFVDLHEDRIRDGFYLLAYAAGARSEVSNVVRSIEIETGVRHARVGERGLVSITETELHEVDRTTASLWARMHGAPHAFVVETSTSMPMEQRVAIHLLAIERLLRLLPAR